jgi:hypothetical protein
MQPAVGKRCSPVLIFSIVTGLIWTVVLFVFLGWVVVNEKKQTTELASTQTEAFYKEFVMARQWIAFHGGVYVPITKETQPNPYLDDPLRDVVTTGGMTLTKVNPAFMTRQIAKLAQEKGLVLIHLASLDASRPENEPDPWEEKALLSLQKGAQEQFEMIESADGMRKYRYMAPLFLDAACMKCHGITNENQGDFKGGISVTIPAEPYINAQQKHIMQFGLTYFIIWLLGLIGIWTGSYSLCKNEKAREKIILQLQETLDDVKKLSGLLPICSSCKNIRNDEGYWEQVEKYIKERSEADFSHGICPQCAKKLYPEIYEKLKNQNKPISEYLRKQDEENKV